MVRMAFKEWDVFHPPLTGVWGSFRKSSVIDGGPPLKSVIGAAIGGDPVFKPLPQWLSDAYAIVVRMGGWIKGGWIWRTSLSTTETMIEGYAGW